MTLLMSQLPKPEEPLPTSPRNKTWVVSMIKQKAPTGKQSYAWWHNFFLTILREQWDIT